MYSSSQGITPPSCFVSLTDPDPEIDGSQSSKCRIPWQWKNFETVPVFSNRMTSQDFQENVTGIWVTREISNLVSCVLFCSICCWYTVRCRAEGIFFNRTNREKAAQRVPGDHKGHKGSKKQNSRSVHAGPIPASQNRFDTSYTGSVFNCIVESMDDVWGRFGPYTGNLYLIQYSISNGQHRSCFLLLRCRLTFFQRTTRSLTEHKSSAWIRRSQTIGVILCTGNPISSLNFTEGCPQRYQKFLERLRQIEEVYHFA